MPRRLPDPGPLDGVDWDDLLPRLLLAARRISRRAGLDRFPGAPSPEDLVQKALASVFEGGRTMADGVTVFNNLYGIMRSQAHAFGKRQRATGGHSGSRFVAFDDAAGASATNPSAPIEDAEFREAALNAVADDTQLTVMLRLLLDNGHLPACELAMLLDTPVEKVYTLTRKLKRRLGGAGLL